MRLIIDEEIQGFNMEHQSVRDVAKKIEEILDENVIEIRIIKKATHSGGSCNSKDSFSNSRNHI
ncbi:hypothetical protein [Aminipila terrae]|uniref:Uncharacterized protein n=1 Tax=Aminipila terrae TaxID=2697030 RepID=A0A6P1MMA3_9FIRM|nr:hypothetical protein [Aminipila terrae]QHI73794.1 hypothetical protein Ami3637_16655 [Aminipila terrae]